MRQSGLILLAAIALPVTAAPAQVGDAQRAIHGIDFRNFVYSPACVEQGLTVTARDGVFESQGQDDRIYFEVRKVSYGDLNGDGVDEAVVETNCNTGGTGQFSDGTVFVFRGNRAVPVASLGIGDRADGGIHALRIENGLLVAERYGQEHSGACCPEYVETSKWRLAGTRLTSAGRPVRKVFLSASRSDETGPVRVRFLKGTSSAVLSGSTNGGERYVLGVRKDQTIELRFSTDDTGASAEIVLPNGTRLKAVRPGETWSGRIPQGGDVTIAIESPASSDSAVAFFDLDLTVR